MARTVVGVLRGGTSSEYDLSLKTGASILNALPEDAYDARDIFIDRAGQWHARGFPVAPARALQQLDVVVNALHGGIGEDGTVQRVLDSVGVPYTGSSAVASALALHKARAGEVLQRAGIRMPQGISFTASHEEDTGVMARHTFAKFGPPYIVKPALEGASHGIMIAASIADLPHVLAEILDEYHSAIVQEFIEGEEATVGVLEDFRSEPLYAFPPVHVLLPDDAPFFQVHHHREGTHRHVVPSSFDPAHKAALVDMAKRAHEALGLSHYSRSDFILTRRGPYLLEVNALPGLHEHAAFPPMLESVGSSLTDFLGHAIQLARR